MRRVDLLIEQARRQTENEEFSETTGINDEEMLQYLNDAQYRLLSLITSTHPTVFVKEAPPIDVVANQESYDLPHDVFIENRITSVEFSPTNDTRNFFKLNPITMAERDTSFTGYPSNYIRRSGKVLLSPIPSSSTGKLRFNYVRRIAELDKRRGRILSVTLGTNTITSLIINISDENYDYAALSKVDFITIVDRKGLQKMIKIEVENIDENTGVVTVDPSFTFQGGETIAVGDYVVGGEDSTTHSELPKMCERYLIGYLAWKVLKRDSSEDSFEQRNEIKGIEDDIVEAFGDTTDDIINIPIIDGDD